MDSTSGQVPGISGDTIGTALGTLPHASAWSPEQKRGALKAASSLAGRVPRAGFFAAGLSGAPGSGKSALAHLVAELVRRIGTEVLVMSLDDYYLPRAERAAMASAHPLWAQRGVPGTHDWARLLSDFDRIRRGETENLRLPRFDKASDDRAPEASFPNIVRPPRVVILEGWLIGAPPQQQDRLKDPVNVLEAGEDADGRWRKAVNDQLARYHSDLESRLHQTWFLAAPDWAHVTEWRWQQECEGSGPTGARHLDDRKAVEGFLQHFERIARHMLRSCRSWADVVIRVDSDHVMRPG